MTARTAGPCVDYGPGPRCPLTAREGPYLLTCCLPAGHDGCCWCNNITEITESKEA